MNIYEANIRRLVDLRDRAIKRGDATAFNDYDTQICANRAALRAMHRRGNIDDPILTICI
ncbi:MAG: hypothetical protein E6Q97_23195 [Desulfurellales bacterium]|nr:MAG: hypothetical protein E6Q97_23195 [Desulfurellales bacterium]